MERLLNNNIFDDKELAKLSPDYVPSNPLLRMQTRSTMVKDTHSHQNVKSEIWQRKTIKRPKGCFKVNKEIAKIRNSYQSINLKNQVMLKNAVKYVDTLKSEDFEVNYEEEYNIIGTETEQYLKEISEKNATLIVQNHGDFKIMDKPKAPKLSAELLNRKNKIKKVDVKLNTKKETDDEVFDVTNFLRIECTLHKPLNRDFIQNDKDVVDHKGAERTMLDTPTPRMDIETDVNNLQSLLIMMPISPKLNEICNESSNDRITNIRDTEDDTKEHIPVLNHVLPLLNTQAQKSVFDGVLDISPLRIEIKDRFKEFLKKYINKWKDYVSKKKQSKAQEREDALNSFFYRLENKKNCVINSPESEPINKAKALACDFNRYRHRYQVQKHIIALQKAKLEEQSRIIEELKYNRIVEASRISIDAMKDEIRKTYNDIDKQLKPKLKCLTNELKLNDIEEPSLVLHCLKVPQFLQRMEKRAREREEKHAMIRERRKQMEEERIKLKQQEELLRAQMDKDEKIKRMKELRDKRKREKIDGIRKQQHAERMRALTVMADLHYEKNLMSKYGIKPFYLLIKLKRDHIEMSKAHYKFQLKKNVFLNWMFYTEDVWYERNYKAEDFYRKKLLRRVFDALRKHHYNYVIKRQVAEDYYDLYVMNLVFRKFREALDIVKNENEKKWQKATMYHNCDILFKTFTCWRSLPALNALRREQEARKARWREKVLQVVPDYAPPED